MKRSMQITILGWVMVFTASLTAFITSKVLAAHGIEIVDVVIDKGCAGGVPSEKALVDYLERIEVKVDDVREKVVMIPEVIPTFLQKRE
jgi:hypothetical protein